MWHAITSYGDSALLLPLIAWVAIVLSLPPQRRDALRWIIAAITTGGTVALSKLVFMAWGIGPPGLDYTGISGHTALSVLTWPCLAAILMRSARRPFAVLAIAAAFVLGLAVGVSRLALEVHSVSEVIMGAALGAVIAAWFIHGLLPAPDLPTWHALVLIAGTIIIWLVFYGRVFPSQHLLKDIALWVSGHSNVFTRRLRLR
ncbi:phosphatase PAP2 family protein [Luteibacter aegosomatissinici]|uniref:phosphatase PAP2 family protein n=1 Tax=Luteibacter aegosomatissinici TaxID=2911539 RepID=UPI001FF7387C|nr:phosphatase PAP2 family protein [Luteibacter aegosomatissinici]UPG92597.1 phosphatase PAP2 family protein [Luteibacter aegosomatissinici]